jgi:hypothetical protein
MPVYEPTPRSKVRRLAERASYDSAEIYPILDAALVCHVAFVVEGQPFVIPTLHARIGDTILLHGSPGSRLIRHLQAGNEVSISVALVDGLVAAKSAFHHSINYRSAVIFGRGRKVEGNAELLKGLEAFTEKILPGRWSEARTPNPEELRVTGMAAVDIVSASAKSRSGPPVDDPADLDLPVWNGVIPLHQAAGPLQSGSPLPASPSVEAFLKLLLR